MFRIENPDLSIHRSSQFLLSLSRIQELHGRTFHNIFEPQNPSIDVPTNPFTVLEPRGQAISKFVCSSETLIDGFWGSKVVKGSVEVSWQHELCRMKMFNSSKTVECSMSYLFYLTVPILLASCSYNWCRLNFFITHKEHRFLQFSITSKHTTRYGRFPASSGSALGSNLEYSVTRRCIWVWEISLPPSLKLIASLSILKKNVRQISS